MVIAAWLLALASLPVSTAAITPQDVLDVTDLSGLVVSPDGKWVAFRTSRPVVDSNDYRIDWYAMSTRRDASPRRVANGGAMFFDDSGAPEAQMPIWSPTSDAFYFRALVGGQVQVWRAGIDGTDALQITHDPANVEALASASGGLVYRVGATREEIETAEQRAHDQGVLVDDTVDMGQPVSRGSVVDGMAASQRLMPGWFSHGGILWQAPSREVRIAFDEAGSGSLSPIASAIGDVTLDPETHRLQVKTSDGATLTCATRSCRAERVFGAIRLRDGRSLLVTTADQGHNERLSVWRPGAAQARTLVKGVGVLNGGRDPFSTCSAAADSVICVAAASTQPPRLVRIALGSGEKTTLFDPNAELRQRIVTPAHELHWTTQDGTALAGQLIVPNTPKPAAGYPLVMSYYSCWEFLRGGGVGDELPVLSLASHGIATLCITNPQAPSPAQQTKAWEYDHAMDAISTITSRLSAQRLVDRRRVGIWGLSFGSEIAMQACWRLPWLAAVSTSTGTLDPDFFWYNSVGGRDTPQTMRKYWAVGDPTRDPIGWSRISPAAHADEIHVALLMQLPEQEARWSLELYSKLSRSTTPVEMYAFANETHVKNQPRHKLAISERNLDWFLFWLTGEIDPAVGKKAQYARWSALVARRAAGSAVANQPRP